MTPEARAAQLDAAAGPRLRALILEAMRLAEHPQRARQARAKRFMAIAEDIGRAIAPHTPCRAGCSHCCHMATAVTGYEAQIIARYTGRTPATVGREGDATQGIQSDLLQRFTAVPCTFLKANHCTIYPVRPMACRTHHSMEDTAEPCRITVAAAVKVARVNLTQFISAQAAFFLDEAYGDIREFFPP